MTNVLITGGTGFVGNSMRKTAPAGFDIEYLNRMDYNNDCWYVHSYDYIVHLAPVSPHRVIKCAEGEHTKVLYCSSGAAYDLYTEYACNKRKWEWECITSGLYVVIARLFTFCGDGIGEEKAISQITKAAISNKPIIISGNGNAVRSYMDSSDLGRYMWLLLEKGKCGEIYDIGSEEPITILNLAKKIIADTGSTSEIIIENGGDRVPYYVPKNMFKTKCLELPL